MTIENVVYCKVEDALAIINGKWKPSVLLILISKGPQRYGELKRQLVDITPKMLSSTLKELEEEGLILREEFAEVPPKVVYSMTPYGMSVEPVLNQLHDWGVNHLLRKHTMHK